MLDNSDLKWISNLVYESEKRTNARLDALEADVQELKDDVRVLKAEVSELKLGLQEVKMQIENEIIPILREVLGFMRNIADVSNTAQKVEQHDEDIKLMSTSLSYHTDMLNNHELRISDIENKYS